MPSAAAAARWLIAWLSAPAIALELPKSLPLRVDHPDLSTIEMQSLHEHMAEYTIVDVRSPYEYNVLHIRDAINLSVADLHFRERLKELYAAKQKPVVTYCNGETCPLSFLAAEVAHSERIPVFVYDAGIWYWARNFPDQAALMPGAKRLIPPEEFKSHLHASRITARCGTDTALHRASLPRQERFSFPREPHLPSPRRGDVTC